MVKIKEKKRSTKKPKKEIKHIPVGPKSRKDKRKDKRNLKKINKKEYFSKTLNGDVGKFVKAPKDDDKEITVIKIEEKNKKNTSKKSGNKKAIDNSNLIMQENKGAKKKEEKLMAEMREKRNSQLLMANKDEDKMIKKLEKQLHLKKKKSGTISKSFAEDGLGYILEVCDERTMQAAVAAEKHRAETGSGSDFDEDIAIATGKPITLYQTTKPKKGKKDSDDQSSDDQFDDFGPSDDESFGSERDDFDSEEEQSFDEDVVKKDHIKKTASMKPESSAAKNKINNKKTFTKSKIFASDSKGGDFNSENEQTFDKEVVKKNLSKKTNSKKVESPKSKNKLNEKKVFSKSKDFACNSEDELSFDDEEEETKKANKVKTSSLKKYIDSPFPKSKNNINVKKATVNHDFGQDSEDVSSVDEEEEIHMKKVIKLKKTISKTQVDSPFPKSKVSISLIKPEKQKYIKKNKGVAKQLVISDDSEDSEHFEDMDADSDMESTDEEMKVEEGEVDPEDMHSDIDEKLRMIYTGLSGFPDESFAPGNLTPVREETAQDLDLYQKNIEEVIQTLANGLNNATVNDMSSDSEGRNKNCFPRKFEKNWQEEDESDDSEAAGMDVDADSDNLSPLTSENSDSDNSDCSSDGSDALRNNKHILVNGKIVNTYGRNYEKEEEPEIVKCPKLDKMLENLSSTESECDKSFEKAKIAEKDQTKLKANLKRKLDEDANMTKNFKKIKQLNNIKPPDKISPKSKGIAKEKSKCKSATPSSESEDEKISPKVKPNKKKKADEKPKKKSKVVPSDDEESDDTGSDDEDFGIDLRSDSDASAGVKPKKAELWEDIYGRKRDHDGNVVTSQTGKYIPPHLRAMTEIEDSKEILQLKRQIKGLLNKVAASNMHWTGAQLEGLYASSSRHAVNSAFCSLWLAALVQATASSARLAAEHTMLVAILHANVGSEVGAHFLQTVVKKFDEMLALEQNLEDKHLDNLILAISHLYSFKLFQAPLLYEILNKLLETLSEKSIECTLVALRSVGGVLRKEDPTALKTFIQTTQERASKFNSTSTKGSRVKFLLDVLLAIKNNNLNKIPNYDPSYTEELKKAMKGIIRKGNYIVPLNIKLEDLLRADERGKWWVVGSAWKGSALEEREQSGTAVAKDTKHSQLMKLALKQRINTDLRRNIFCIIMGAEDYMDAFEKLQQIGLKNQQEREIILILMTCCLQEKTYNPYYAVLAQKYCDYDRKFQMAIQYSIWDKLKEIDTYPSFQIANLGQFITYLFLEKGLPISILKVVEFANLTKATLRLMRQILLAILLCKRWQTCLEVFQRVAVSRKLHLFREGLRLFINHFLLKNFDKKESILSEDQKTLLQERASAVDKTLHGDSKLQF